MSEEKGGGGAEGKEMEVVGKEVVGKEVVEEGK